VILDASIDKFATSLITDGAKFTVVVCNIEPERSTFWQQEWDADIFIDPHWFAMCWQHSRSAIVIWTPGVRQVIAEEARRTAKTEMVANW
jgi:hypothetical protein